MNQCLHVLALSSSFNGLLEEERHSRRGKAPGCRRSCCLSLTFCIFPLALPHSFLFVLTGEVGKIPWSVSSASSALQTTTSQE